MSDKVKLLMNPKYWGIAIALGLGYLLSFIPFKILRGIGSFIGYLGFYIAKKRRHIVICNLKACFPKLSEQEITSLAKANFKEMGIAFFEIALAWWWSDEKLLPLIRYEGLEHLAAANANSKGTILVTAHACCLELSARAVSLKTPLTGMYRPHKNAFFEQWQYALRERLSQHPPISREEVRKTLRILKRGDMIWYAPDQNYGGSEHVFVPFFGIDALTITATSKLAKVTKAQVLPYYIFKKVDENKNPYYLIRIYPILDNFPSEDVRADTLRINSMIESWISERPEQYLWAHRRFKSRPEGEASIY
ncbi:lauryl-acyl carrier protein-dependent acyltransferase [Gammaproteobacteria bacterium]|nr:lauryl-acyl carrier protein-dependent acyltransferase [Gammaproteobacteria bacterium]